MSDENTSDIRLALWVGLMAMYVGIFIFLLSRATEPLNAKLCRESGLYLKMDRGVNSPLNGHLTDGTPTYNAYFVDCK